MTAEEKIKEALAHLETARRLLWDVDEGKTEDKRFSIPDNNFLPAEFWHLTHNSVSDAFAIVRCFLSINDLLPEDPTLRKYAREYLEQQVEV